MKTSEAGCDCSIKVKFLFCPQCGKALNHEDGIITDYFEKSFEYEKILNFLFFFLTFFYSYYATITTKVLEDYSDKHYGMAKIFFYYYFFIV